MRRYILNVMLLLLPFSGLVAQSGNEIFEQKAIFEPLTDSKEYNDVCVQDDEGGYHAINGVKRIVELSSEDYTIEWIYPTIIINGEETHVDAGEQKNLISYEIENSGRYRLLLDSVKWISKDGVRDTICRNLDIDNFDIELHEVPHITRNDIEGRSKEVIWDNTITNLLVEYEGGNTSASGWTLAWKLGGGTVETTYAWNRTIGAGSQTLTLEIKNMAPDGTTPWFERSFSCDFQVYRYPKDDEVKLMFRNKECPKSMDWYCGDTSTDKILVSTNTGDGYDWKYQWQYAGDVESSEIGFRPSMKDMDVPSFTGGKAYEYTVTVSNCPEGMHDSLYYHKNIEGTVNFWKTPEINPSYEDYAVVFDNTEVVVGLEVDGGIPDYSRKATLSLDNIGVSMTENTPTQIKFRPSIDSRKEDCEYILSTSFVNENTSVELKNAIDLTVWKTPEVDLHYISNNTTGLDSRYSHPVNGTIYVCEKFGGEVKLLLINKEKYGDDNGWTYSWKDRSSGVAETESEETKTLAVDAAGTVYDFELEVINQPEDMKIGGFKKIIPFQVEICPTPYINLEAIKSAYAGMHGEELALQLGDDAVGKGGEWRYQWLKDGEVLEEESPTLSLVNSTNVRITENWTAVPKYYGPLGDVWYGDAGSASKSFSVNIYPLPIVNIKGFDKPRLDAFYDGEITYSIGVEGEYDYASSWEYEISYNGIEVVDTVVKGVLFSPDNHTISPNELGITSSPYSKTGVTMSVRCSVYDSATSAILNAYSEERALDYYAWRKGEISQNLDFPKETYYNERYTLMATPQYGYVHDGTDGAAEGGWEFEWTCNQSSGVIGQNNSYGYSNNNENDSTTVVYTLRCRNVLNGEVSVADTFYYQFKEFARIVEAEKIGDYRVDVRYDDGVTYKIEAPTGGNPDGWRYEWKKEVGTSEIQMMSVTSMIDGVIPEMSIIYEDLPEGYSKHYQDVTYQFVCRNYTTDGDYVDDSETIIEFPVRIHRKPNVENFTLKGNGKSQIYMASSASTSPEYEFGHGSKPDPYDNNPANKDKNGSVGNKQGKWISYRYQSKPIEPWVRTYWYYDGKNNTGFRCYSDACYIGEKAKAPAFSRELKVEDGYFYVNLEEEASATVRLYTLDGKIVRTQQYPPQMDFNEKLDLDGLTSGMYILQCAVGELQVVKKVVVR